MAHDLLDNARRDIFQGKCGSRCVSAGIGSQAAAPGPLKGCVVCFVESVLIYPDELFAFRVFTEVCQNRQELKVGRDTNGWSTNGSQSNHDQLLTIVLDYTERR